MKKEKIRFFIDSNVWNYFYEINFNFEEELLLDEFQLLTDYALDIEIASIPDLGLKKYINNIKKLYDTREHCYFGFISTIDKKVPPGVTGFSNAGIFYASVDTFLSEEDAAIMVDEDKRRESDKIKKNGLSKNETDIGLVAKSVNAVVLTRDNKRAFKRGMQNLNCNIINPKDCPADKRLGDFIKGVLNRKQQS